MNRPETSASSTALLTFLENLEPVHYIEFLSGLTSANSLIWNSCLRICSSYKKHWSICMAWITRRAKGILASAYSRNTSTSFELYVLQASCFSAAILRSWGTWGCASGHFWMAMTSTTELSCNQWIEARISWGVSVKRLRIWEQIFQCMRKHLCSSFMMKDGWTVSGKCKSPASKWFNRCRSRWYRHLYLLLVKKLPCP